MSEPLPPVPNVIKATIEGVTSFLKNWNTLFHFLYTGGPPTEANLVSLAAEVLSFFQTNFLPSTPPSTTIATAMVTDLSTVMMPTAVVTNSMPGTSTADKLPANCAVLFNWNVGMRYRGGHPRNYIYTGADENLLNESQWNTAFLDTMATAMNNFMGDLTDVTFGSTTIVEPVMVSYFGGVPTIGGVSQRRAVPLVLPITMGRVNPFIASQRRRIGRAS